LRKYLALSILALSVLLAAPLSAAENAKINLPDGLYMCDPEISQNKNGDVHIRFDRFFVVRDNTIYSSLQSLKKFGVIKLNKLFAEKKKYKILLGGKKIGAIDNIRVDKHGRLFFDEKVFVKSINQNPTYGPPHSLGCAARCIAVPEEYKESRIKVYNTIPKREVDNVLTIVKNKLFNLAKERKEYTQSYGEATLKSYPKDSPPKNYKDTSYHYEELQFLDKISRQNGEFCIGLYWYHFTSAPVLQIIFTIKNNNISIITTNHDDKTLEGSEMSIYGMLDVDGCGEAELLVRKGFGGTAGGPVNMEIYKQYSDGNWRLITKFRMGDTLEWQAYRYSIYDAESAALAKKYAKNIKLPDGLYMYDSSISRLENGSDWVGFGKWFVVRNNMIYSSQDAIKQIGVSELNALFTENKKYKVLLGGQKIGEIHNVRIELYNDEMEWNYKEELFTKGIKQGPLYVENKYLRTGSAVKCIGVPEKYKEIQRKVYSTISQEEIDKISKLAKEKLFHLIKNRKEITQYKIKDKDLTYEKLELLDKISHRNDELYIGIYRYAFKTTENNYDLQIVFSVEKDNVNVITSGHDDETGDYDGDISIYGMLDVDGCGEEELIMEKVSGGLDEALKNISIYKRKADGNWTRIQKISWRVTS